MDLSESCDSIDKSFIIDDFEVGRLWRVYLYRVCVSLYAKRHYRHKQYFVAVVSIDSNRSIMSNQVRKKNGGCLDRNWTSLIETDRNRSRLIANETINLEKHFHIHNQSISKQLLTVYGLKIWHISTCCVIPVWSVFRNSHTIWSIYNDHMTYEQTHGLAY